MVTIEGPASLAAATTLGGSLVNVDASVETGASEKQNDNSPASVPGVTAHATIAVGYKDQVNKEGGVEEQLVTVEL